MHIVQWAIDVREPKVPTTETNVGVLSVSLHAFHGMSAVLRAFLPALFVSAVYQ
jgi:hypothetical protein